MRMDTMNKIFEARGFEVERKWEESAYRFTISKNGFNLSEGFCYSGSETDQVTFIEGMIKKFEALYPSILPRPYASLNTFKSIQVDASISNGPIGVTTYNKIDMLLKKDVSLSTIIVEVIFNNPATIIKWIDGTKTVVKSNGEDYDPEKGFAMAIAKKAFGNKGNYYNAFKQWLPKNEDAESPLGGARNETF